MEENNEIKIRRAELMVNIRPLVLKSTEFGAGVIGFVFGGDPPVLIRFGNIQERGPELTEVLLKLSDISEEKELEGKIIETPIERD